MILNDYTRIEVNSQINIIFYSFLITIIIIIVSFNSNTRMLSENKCVVCWQNWYPKLKRWAQHIENTITCAVITISLWARDVSPPKYIYIWNVAIISPHSCIVANYPHSIYRVNERIRNAWINAHFYLKFYKIIFCTFFPHWIHTRLCGYGEGKIVAISILYGCYLIVRISMERFDITTFWCCDYGHSIAE